uniref:Uncharacterized protein n=1 Tax=Arundo donax TaxID=35708 RepID=A0A0A9AM93_ARUDO
MLRNEKLHLYLGKVLSHIDAVSCLFHFYLLDFVKAPM